MRKTKVSFARPLEISYVSLMETIRFGLVGTGKHGSRYAKHIVEDIPQAALVAVCRRDRLEGEALAAKYNCTYYTDYRQLLADDRINAVAVAVPPYLHREVVSAACHAGKHILLEKPFAVSVAEGRRLQELLSHSLKSMHGRSHSAIQCRCPSAQATYSPDRTIALVVSQSAF